MRITETAAKAEPSAKPRLPERFYKAEPQEFVGVLPVPGVPEADDALVALARLEAWCKRLAINPPAGVRVLPR